MADETGPGAAADPMQLWRQWYDTTFQPWSDALAQGGAQLDPLGLYRQWLDGLDQGQRSRDGVRGGPVDGVGGRADAAPDVNRLLLEATTETWRRAAEVASAFARLAPRWAELAEALRTQLLTPPLPTDPLDAVVRWYNATSGPLSGMIRDLLSDEAYLGYSRRLLEAYATLDAVSRRAAEDFFGRLQLSTSSDSARVAALVVGLDEKLDRLEDALEDGLADARVAASDASRAESGADEVGQLRAQVGRLEEKLDRVLAATSVQSGEETAR